MQKVTPKDLFFMRRAIALARRGEGRVHPNPLVGAVLVKAGRIIGEGAHQKFGGLHAEVFAIQKSGQKAKGATLYVTLEPCSHYGKTGPCADLILESGIKKVVIAARDKNPLVNGRGIRKLKKAGVRVVEGVLEKEAAALNRDFNHWVRHKVPYGVIKVAQSLDGKIATKTGESRWITGKEAREFSQTLRASSDAILVGVNTVLKDNPSLSVRNGRKTNGSSKTPFKVVLDSFLRTPLNANIFSNKSKGPVIIAASHRANKNRLSSLRKKAQVLVLPEKKGRVDLRLLFKELARRGIVKVLIEGGGAAIADILDKRLARELYWFVAPKIIGGKNAVHSVAGEGVGSLQKAVALQSASVRPVGKDFLIHGFIS